MGGSSSTKIKSLSKAMEILGLMAQKKEALSLTEISKISGYPISTVYGIIATLRDYEIIEQDFKDGKYCLGKRLFEWGMSVSSVWDVSAVAHPVMQEVSANIGESVLLSTVDGTEVLIIDHVEAYAGITVAAKPGSRLPLYATSQGKLLLAYMPQSEAKRLMKMTRYNEYTPHTITNEDKLFNELGIIKNRGYAIEDGEFRIGLRSVSAPVFDMNGKVQHTLTMTGMFRRVTSKEFENAIGMIIAAAERISLLLGYKK